MRRHFKSIALFALISAAGRGAEAQPVEDAPKQPQNEETAADDGAVPKDEPREGESPSVEPSDPQEDTAGDVAEGSEIRLPKIIEQTPPVYPEGVPKEAHEIICEVTLDSSGKVTKVAADSESPPAFARAAEESVRSWRFVPAARDGVAMASKIRVRVSFVPPPPQEPAAASMPPSSTASTRPSQNDAQEPSPEATGSAPSEDSTPLAEESDDSHLSVTVHGERPLRTEKRAASDFFIHREILGAAPHSEGVDALSAVPGLTMARSEGLAVAHSYNLRGFDAAHGQDIEFVVGGLPINQPSHIHGQGYADLSFLVGDVVDELWVSEGVSDPAQGDFAVAGSVDVGLGVDEEHRGLQLRSEYGSFNTFRQSAVWAPKGGARENFGAVQFQTTGGFGENRSGKAGSAILQQRFGSGAVRYRVIGLISAAKAQSAGYLRESDVESGAVCFYCTYPDPSSQAQGASNQRLMAGFFADYRGRQHASGTLGAWVGYDNFNSKMNPTGYLRRSQTLPGVYGLGDLIEQTNQNVSLGLTGRYRTEAFDLGPLVHGTVEVGADGRVDNIRQEQGLIDAAVRNQIWDELIDARISALQMAMWGDLDFQITERFNLRAGARAALLSYDVQDRLANFAPVSRPQDQRIDGLRRNSMGLFLGPRASAEFRASKAVSLLGSYGEGYRSPQARTLEDGENAPFARVRSVDAGTRLRIGEVLQLTALGYLTALSDDAVFDATEGTLERVGRTLRAGATAYGVLRPADWFLAALSVTYVHASLREPPPATAEQPLPPFSKGQLLPYVPPLVVRLDTMARRTLLDSLGSHPLLGTVGLGFTYRSPRPLPYSQMGDAWTLLDASLGLLWGPFDLKISGYNLLDRKYKNDQFVYTSHFAVDEPTTRVPETHMSAGAPLSVMGSLGVTL